MKLKIYSLLMIAFMLIASSITMVNADINSTNKSQISITKTVKVNKTYKIKKLLKSNGNNVDYYSFKSSNKKVAKVSKKGTVTGLKVGKATITITSKVNGSTYGTVNIIVKNRYNSSDLRMLSSIIYSESGNQVYAGKKAVGIVVMNRVRSTLFPNTVSGVVYQSGQFTPARNGSLSRSLSLYDSGNLNSDCIKAAKDVLNGDNTVSYNSKTIDMSSYLYFSGYVPGCRLQIQNHQFK